VSRKKKYYILGCLISFPLSTPYLDLFLTSVFLFVIFLNKDLRGASLRRLFVSRILPNLLFLFLLCRDIVSIFTFFDLKTVRIILVHLVLFLFALLSNFDLLTSRRYKLILNIGIFYFASYTIFYIITKIKGEDWATLQTVYLTGSVYAAIPFLFISYSILENSTRQTMTSEMVLVLLALISATVYSSRTLLLFIFLFLFTFLFKSKIEVVKRLQFFSILLFLSIFLSAISGTFVSHTKPIQSSQDSYGVESSSTSEDSNLKNFIKDLSASALFLFNNRQSDQDRKSHLLCGIEALKNRGLITNIFGSGTNTYRHTLASCTQFGGPGYSDEKIIRKDKGSQSISFTITLIDYGILPFVLIFIMFFHHFSQFFNQKNSLVYMFYFVLNFYLFFITNLGPALIVWLFFVAPYLGHYKDRWIRLK